MSRHARDDDAESGALPEIPRAPDSSPEAESRRRRSPYSGQPATHPRATGEQAYDHQPLDERLVGHQPAAIPTIDKPPLDGVSVAAVATGAVGLGPVAIVLGAVGLRRTTKQWRRSPAIAGVGLGLGVLGTLGWVGLGVAAGLGAFGGPDLTATPGDVPSARTVHASALAAGNCVETVPPQQEVGEVRLVPCAQAHLAQVLAVEDYPADTYPGQDPALETATAWCAGLLAEHGFHAEAFLAWPIVPTPAAWDQDVRSMACLTRSTLGQITGDLT